jgi:replicative DNA helicase
MAVEKIPPQSIELEEAVLGAMMIDKNGQIEAIDILKKEVFHKDAHKHIFEAIVELFTESKVIDLLTVSAQLRKNSKLELVGGDFYLINLTQKISSSAHIEYHSRILLQKFTQRECIAVSSNIIENAYNEDVDVFELIESAYKELGSVTDLLDVGKTINFQDSVNAFLNKSQHSVKGIPSSLTRLNRKLNGYQNSDLIILAARPGMGKTSMVLNEIIECGLNNIPVVFFSLEMSERQIISRMLSIISGIDNTKIRNFNLTPSEIGYLKQCTDLLSKMPIIIDDTSGLSPIEVKIKCNKLKREKGIKMVVVDYLQLLKIKNKKVGNREQEISEISGSLKNLAKDLDVPVIALSQLSRAVEGRGGTKRPMLSDLRDSGSIEQDADIVMFIYRPEYYKIDEWDDNDKSPTTDEAEIDIQKFREGEVGCTRVGCELKFMRFTDIENKGKNIQHKYFKIETPNIELPKLQPVDAFDEPSDVPF